jgi:Ca-activated chloride channel family protein
MNLAQPAWLVALVLLPLWWVARARGLARGASPLASAEVGEGPPTGGGVVHVFLFLETTFLALCLLALAAPYREETVERVGLSGVDVALVLDISASMQAADMPPHRLDVLKDVAQRLVRGTAGSRVAVYAFAGFVSAQAPLTDDRDALLSLLDGLSYRSIDHDDKSGGTAIGDALLVAADDLLSAREEGRDQVIVLVSDGENGKGADPERVATLLAQDGFSLHVIGMGGDEEVQVMVDGEPFLGANDQPLFTKLDDAQLRRVAMAAGGTYARAADGDVLREIFDAISVAHAKPLASTRVRIRRSLASRIAWGAWLAFVAAWSWDLARMRRPAR